MQAVYAYYGLDTAIDDLDAAVGQLESGGTLAVQLGSDALRRGFAATIYTYNLLLFDPTWFGTARIDLRQRLAAQAHHKEHDQRLRVATSRYLEFLELGGRVEHEALTPDLLSRFLGAGTPILTGLSATYLHGTPREVPDEDRPDDVRGSPVGHFVVLCGYDAASSTVTLADPWPDPGHPDQVYERPLLRVLSAILLGVLTYDANLLVIEP